MKKEKLCDAERGKRFATRANCDAKRQATCDTSNLRRARRHGNMRSMRCTLLATCDVPHKIYKKIDNKMLYILTNFLNKERKSSASQWKWRRLDKSSQNPHRWVSSQLAHRFKGERHLRRTKMASQMDKNKNISENKEDKVLCDLR